MQTSPVTYIPTIFASVNSHSNSCIHHVVSIRFALNIYFFVILLIEDEDNTILFIWISNKFLYNR